MRLIVFLIFIFLGCGVSAQDVLKSPVEFLPTAYSEAFTPHRLVVSYFKHVAENSPSVQFQQYGWSVEKRPLCVAIISTPENIKNLNSIRKNNLKLTGLENGSADVRKAKSIVWVNFGVHGNEPGATESALRVLHELAAKKDKTLQDVIVILNPSLNPDGLSRYVNWNRQVANKVLTSSLLSREHQENWPTGRGNHYYFDLNRDWAWASQPETKSLLDLYHEWMPHIVLDLHEQQPEKHYYFAPATEPIHDYITDFQRSFQRQIGQHNASEFDKQKWLYFTGEVFDLFYPGYGDTYPSFNGAVGMTYEQAGHGVSGKGLKLGNGKLLYVKDRIEHHTKAVLATIETASQSRKEIIKAFKWYFDKSKNEKVGEYEGFVIKKSRSAYRLEKLTSLLSRHHIKYHSVQFSKDAIGYDYQKLEQRTFVIDPGDLVVSSKQSMGILANVLLEPKSNLSDSMTYDITAWSLPYAFNLEAYAVLGDLPDLIDFPIKTNESMMQGFGHYAWVIPWNDVLNVRFLSEVLQKGVKVRFANTSFSIGGKEFGRGSLIITKSDNNQKLSRLKKILSAASTKHQVSVYAQESGLTQEGPNLGSTNFKLIKKPNIALVYGSSVNAYSYGEVWHFLDNELSFPFVALSFSDLKKNMIWNFNTIIFSKGDYSKLPIKTRNFVKTWIKKGGNLILIDEACQSLDISTFDLNPKEADLSDGESFIAYVDKERDVLGDVPGGIVKVLMDHTHPLGFGYGDIYFSMKTSEISYDFLVDGHTVGRTPAAVETIGYFGNNFKNHLDNNLIFGVQEIGLGQVIFLIDNPLFRNFWEGGKLLMGNALFFR